MTVGKLFALLGTALLLVELANRAAPPARKRRYQDDFYLPAPSNGVVP